MATAAERQRRSRAHKRGDHSGCDPSRRCGVTPEPGRDSEPVVTSPEPVTPPADGLEVGEIEAEVQEFTDQLLRNFPDGDPRRILCSIAVKLARRVDATDASPGAINQLRILLMQIAEVPEQPAGPVDGTRAKRAARRIGALIR